jgi:hypothetical protein
VSLDNVLSFGSHHRIDLIVTAVTATLCALWLDVALLWAEVKVLKK